MSLAKRKSFAARVRQGPLVVAPGIFDMISARIADQLGFDALSVPLNDFKRFSALVGFDRIAEFDQRYRGIEETAAGIK